MAIAACPTCATRCATSGLAAQSGTPQQFADLLRTETEKVARIVKDAGIKLE